jgi:hypothetical protein
MLKQGELKVFAHLKDKKYAIHRPDLAVYNDFNPCVLEIICHPSIYISIDTILSTASVILLLPTPRPLPSLFAFLTGSLPQDL